MDVMPTEAAIFGMASEWFLEAVTTPTKRDLGAGVQAPVITRLCSLATKLTAYHNRGAKDPYMSIEALEGCFRADPVSRERSRIVFDRMRSIATAR